MTAECTFPPRSGEPWVAVGASPRLAAERRRNPEGVDQEGCSAPSGPSGTRWYGIRGFHPRLLTVLPFGEQGRKYTGWLCIHLSCWAQRSIPAVPFDARWPFSRTNCWDPSSPKKPGSSGWQAIWL